MKFGLCTLFIRHTSASLLIQESYDDSARVDLENWLNRLVPERDDLFRMAPDYFDSRRVTIAGGSTEIQKDLVARRMLGL